MATRKSARIIAKASVDAVAAPQLVQNATQKTAKPAQGSRNLKKRKISNEKDASSNNTAAVKPTRKGKGKRGDSTFMKEIPFDVLLEIFKLLEPIDLLLLSRVSKTLRAELTSNDMVGLWKSAYQNTARDSQPPSCPDDANIIYYTNYLYGRHCQFCSSIHGRFYHESAFIRLCSKCTDTGFVTTVSNPIRDLCNQWTLAQYRNLGPMNLKAEFHLRLKELAQAQKEKNETGYVKEREQIVSKRYKFAQDLARWRTKMQEKKRREMRANSAEREADLKAKIEAEGYKPEFDALWNRVNSVPHLRKAQALTDSEWNVIRADILDFFQNVREKRALDIMRSQLQVRIAQLEEFNSQWKICPTAWWLASSEPIASFIKSELPNKRFREDFEKVKPQIRKLITSWTEETDRYLATLIPRPSGRGKKNASRNSKTNALELATTFFKCHWCTEPISYPRILVHGCLLKDQEEESDDDMEDLEEDVFVKVPGPRDPRPPKEITPDMVLPMLSARYSLGMRAGKEGVTYDEEASNAARDIITACGEDPNTVTYAAMEGAHAKLECLRCSQAMQVKQKARSGRLVLAWAMAVMHELEEHYGEPLSSKPAWRKVDSLEDLAKIEAAESKMMQLKKYQKVVCCNHCSWLGVSLDSQLHHIINKHKVITEKAAVSDHFSPQVDESIKNLYPPVKI